MKQGVKRAEELRQNPNLFRMFVEGVKDYAIFMLDPQGFIISWNTGAEHIKGYAAAEIIGRHFSCLYPEKDVRTAKPEKELQIAVRDGRLEDEGWRVRKDGSLFWANVIITPTRSSGGELLGFCKVTRDLTERKRLEFGQLLRVTTVALRSVTHSDAASTFLFEPTSGAAWGYTIDFSESKGFLTKSAFSVTENSVTGRILPISAPTLFTTSAASWPRPPLGDALLKEGLKSGCLLPLHVGEDIQGILGMFSFREDAFRNGDVDFLSGVVDQLASALENTLQSQRYLESMRAIDLGNGDFGETGGSDFVGKSDAMSHVLDLVEKVAKTDSTVLILGETGTGKELIASAIHNRSSRRDRAFVRTNCASIPSGLLESELFGHEKGAFTGATERAIGRFELANRGTLFLDEIGDVPLELQSKLLRVLQEQEIERLGSIRPIKVDFRLIAATNRDLAQMVQHGQFRSDLYYRLNIFPIEIPPLRERREDITPLIRHFVDKYARQMNKKIETIAEEDLEELIRYEWPGNIRELQNVIERSVILTRDTALHARVPTELNISAQRDLPRSKTLEAAEREHILEALRETDGVIGGPNGAASMLGLKRTTLLYKMRRLGISRSHK